MYTERRITTGHIDLLIVIIDLSELNIPLRLQYWILIIFYVFKNIEITFLIKFNLLLN